MSSKPVTLTQAERLTMAQRLVDAIAAGDEATEHEVADAIGRARFAEMYTELDRITRQMQDTLCNVGVTHQLARLAHKELPGAQLRLTQVMDLTEDAANKTLNAVEEALPLAQRLVNLASDSLAEGDVAGTPPDLPASIREVLEAVAGDAGLLRERLSDVMLAQGFQDLTGQIMRPVVQLVGELTASLEATLGIERDAQAEEDSESKGHGPAVKGLNDSQSVSGQQDVDDLMASLGL
jgi:chemotaxis protein CheZ